MGAWVLLGCSLLFAYTLLRPGQLPPRAEPDRGLLAGRASALPSPPGLNQERYDHIWLTMWSRDSKVAWSNLIADGEEVVPYIALILSEENEEDTETNDRAVYRALTFANTYLAKYNCKSMVDPTVKHLMHESWELRDEALCLLGQIGGQADCLAAAMLLYSDVHYNRAGAGCILGKSGGRAELFVLDHWLSVRAADAKAEHDGDWKAFESITESRDRIRARLDAEAKKKPVEATEADKVVAKFADAEAKVRAAAVGELRKVGSRADSSAVVALLHDSDAKVREAAAEWLEAVGGKRELIALEIRIREKRAADDPAFDAFARAKKAVAERVEADAKKEKKDDPKAKPPEKK